MKVSVIVLTYNRAHLVTGTIDSILKQTFRDFELIIVDDYSHDDTEKVIKAYTDERIKYIKHDSGRLVAVNWNYGMSHAGGEYIAFCGDDDLWLPDKLEKQLLEFEKDDCPGLVCSNAVIFNEMGNLRLYHETGLDDTDFTLKSLLGRNRIISSSVMVRKSVINDVGGMNIDPVFYNGEDYELWLRISRKYKIRYLDLPLVKFRKHSIHLHQEGIASLKHIRKIYRWLLDTNFINRWLYWRLVLRTLPIEFLLRTRTIKLASWLKRLIR
jgi:glycosyltransferase involved in cell wall biosynthesis